MVEKKLYRSSTDQMLGGVAAGIADYLEVDTTLIRLLWALAIFAGFGIPAYIVAWIIIPLDPSAKSTKTGAEEIKDKAEQVASDIKKAARDEDRRDAKSLTGDLRFWLGLFIVFFAVALLFQNIFGFALWHNFWPLLLVAFGVVLIAGSVEKR